MTPAQKQLLEVLKHFVAVCEANGLQYWICGGTLLGAIRHKGFIPWDDDIDVEMPYADYQKLLSLDALCEGTYALQNRDTDPDFPFLFTKLCNTALPYTAKFAKKPLGMHIDIFPLLPSKPYSKKTKAAYNIIREIEYVLRDKVGWRKYVPNGRLARFGYYVLKCFSKKQLMRIQSRAIRYLCDPDGQTYCSIGGTYHAHQEFSPKAWYEGSDRVTFEGLACNACAHWDAWLTNHYGDYMTLPPIEKRVSHHGN